MPEAYAAPAASVTVVAVASCSIELRRKAIDRQ